MGTLLDLQTLPVRRSNSQKSRCGPAGSTKAGHLQPHHPALYGVRDCQPAASGNPVAVAR
jgi:hypothetical protein